MTPDAALDTRLRPVLARRVGQVVSTLTGHPAPSDMTTLFAELERLLDRHQPEHYWLTCAAIAGRLPDEQDVLRATGVSRLRGPRAALEPWIQALAGQVAAADGVVPELEIVQGGVTIDVDNTASVTFTSGIQRVVRECVHRWSQAEDVRLVAWTKSREILRPVSSSEWANVTLGRPAPDEHPTETIVLPWRGTHLVPELAVDGWRTLAIASMARFAPVTVSVIGYDVIPLTTPACTVDGMVQRFARHLAGVAHYDRVAAISPSAATEYSGWRSMLTSRGLTGPDITSITLPVHAPDTTPAQLEEARALLTVGTAPLVLVVGSHEPRKNHLAVLHAAELLWREGHRFSIAFVGSGSWKADAFYARVADLQAAGRPLQSISGLSDDLLWAAYRLAHSVVFPSINEGFGLPVAEALACGTPVVTSDFGSMADMVAPEGKPLGGLLVDAHDDHDIARAIRSLLVDRDLHARLRAEATTHRLGSWDEYAAAAWDYLVHGRRPAAQIAAPRVS